MKNRLARNLIALCIALCFVLSGCSAMQAIGTAAKAITPSGAAVDAAVQVGKDNNKEGDALVQTRRDEARRSETEGDGEAASDAKSKTSVSGVSGVSSVKTENVQNTTQSTDSSTDQSSEETGRKAGVNSGDWSADSINLDQVPTIFLVLFALGWLMPGAATMYKGIGHGLLFIKRDLLGFKGDKENVDAKTA